MRRYASEQNWQRKQFAYDYAERIAQDADVSLALKMIDWTQNTVSTADAARHGCNPFQWTIVMVAGAPDDHNNRGGAGFTKEESLIRTVFDAMLEKFERLGAFLDDGVLNRDDFPTTFKYYVDVLNEPRLAPLSGQLSAYMSRYGFVRARSLFARLGANGFS